MELTVTSSDFKEGDWIPVRNTARGEDRSPNFKLQGISNRARSIAITMDDASHPLFKNYNHWIIWNIPVQDYIPGGIPKGEELEQLRGAKQGTAYGKHCYKGPKPPLRSIHTYIFTFYILDTILDLSAESTKADFLKAAEGHILQKAVLTGKYQSHRKEEKD